jgi:hypothetical protein
MVPEKIQMLCVIDQTTRAKWQMEITSWQQANVFGWDAISTGYSIAGYRQ